MNTKILQALWTNMCKCSAVYGFRQKWNQGKSTCRIGISLTLQNWLVPGNKTLLASIRQVNPLLSRHSISVLNRRLAFTRLFLQCFYYIICLKLVSCQWNKRVNKQNNNTLTMCYFEVSCCYTMARVKGLLLLCLYTRAVYLSKFTLPTE